MSLEYAIGVGVLVIGFFLKDLFSRFNKLESKVENNITKYNQEFGKLVGKVSVNDTKTTQEIKNLESLVSIQFKNLGDKVEELQRIIESIDKK